jgi:hypothetical protein
MARHRSRGLLVALLVLFHIVMVASLKRPEEPRLFVGFCLMLICFVGVSLRQRQRE